MWQMSLLKSEFHLQVGVPSRYLTIAQAGIIKFAMADSKE